MPFDKLQRREFIALFGGTAVVFSLSARAQQPAKLPSIGFLGASTQSAVSQWTAKFVQQLHELGWMEGRTVTIAYRWAEGSPKSVAEFTHSNVALVAAKQATSMIPIVFGAAGDPVGAGLVASLARPGGNVTGVSIQQTDTAAKRLELLREVVPHLRRLAILTNVGNPAAMLEMNEVQAGTRRLGLDPANFEFRRSEDIASAFEALRGRADALYVCNDPLVAANRIRISTLASSMRLPTIYNFRENVEAGGLMSYGANIPDMFRRAAYMVDKILRGAKPADIPVEQPTKFDLVINLTTAKALGLTVPESFLLRADEIIE
jgi:ABC-type uncharacterized transport system substrate-binding protein